MSALFLCSREPIDVKAPCGDHEAESWEDAREWAEAEKRFNGRAWILTPRGKVYTFKLSDNALAEMKAGYYA
jgi:hypothetical protein